ncbi:AAA family ATPase [Desulfonatronospira sp.]|uniref:AAA family ATPase n=1 Tax=Desulfonatronospira sp. TaxID=1962951 RepID=UPI0025BEFDE8|nr:AAA family ATPase [Desulfonatronospira sp.]
MLKSLHIKNMTVFQKAGFDLSPGLNVVVGENGSGKTHFLKTAYCILSCLSVNGPRLSADSPPNKTGLQTALAEKIIGVFRPESLGRTVHRGKGRERCQIDAFFEDSSHDISFSLASQSRSEVSLEKVPESWLQTDPVYIPTREILTLYPNLISLYEKKFLEFPQTYRDLCIHLGSPLERNNQGYQFKSLLSSLEKTMGGSIILDKNGRFYFKPAGQVQLEIPLVAEGIRKLAMLAQLVATGVIRPKGTAFWDEPDTSLNPRLVARVARFIMDLAQAGVQIFIATHSLFLLREIEILHSSKEYRNTPARFFALHFSRQGVQVQQGTSMDDLDPIAALDEELSQSDRFMELD